MLRTSQHPHSSKTNCSSWWRAVRLVVLLSLIIIGWPSESPSVSRAQANSPVWEYVNPMHDARCCFTATLMPSGKIFAVGGNGSSGSAINTTELYDPALNSWMYMATMGEARQQHSATLLTDGRVLVAGGVINGNTNTVKATVEIYDPVINKWTATGKLHTARANHFDVRLPDGRVFVGGGYTTNDSLDSAELYNPATGNWTVAAPIPWKAQQQTATLLNDGTVLVTGGYNGLANNVAAIYTPSTNSWQSIQSMHFYRTGHSATLLQDGRVLVTSYYSIQGDIYDPKTQTWSLTKPVITPRWGDSASLLPSGEVLVSGGSTASNGPVVDSTEIYNPTTNEWRAGARMQQTTENHISVMLSNKYLLVLGGAQNNAVFNTVERYGPVDLPSGCTPSSVVILENDTCTISLTFSTVNVNSSSFKITATADDPSLIPNANLTFQGTGSARTLTITPAKTNAKTAPTHQGKAIVTVDASDGTQSETLRYQVNVIPPPWLAMLYLNGDDGLIPGTDANTDQSSTGFESIAPAIKRLIQEKLPEMKYNPTMRLVVVADFHDSVGDSRVYVRDPDGLNDITPQLRADQSRWPGFTSELNTADPSTVRGFVNWTRTVYPGSTYSFLSMVDHGGGWAPDFNGTDGQPRGIRVGQAGGWRGMSVDYTGDGSTKATMGQSMSTKDTHRALEGLGLNVVFFDACLMGMLESAYEVRDDADYLIAGENQLFAEFPYDDYFAVGNLKVSTTPEALAVTISQNYNRKIDSTANPFTIAALNLQKLRASNPADLPSRVDTLAQQILAALPTGTDAIPTSDPLLQAIFSAYNDSLKFDYDSSLTLDPHEGYVDLQDFVNYLINNRSLPAAVESAARDVKNAIPGQDNFVIDLNHKQGTYRGIPMDFTHSSGVSIYLPLGEQDDRPTHVDPNNPGCPASAEPQLPYYNDPNQLAFRNNFPNWAAMLVRLQNNVTVKRAPIPAGCTATQSLATIGDTVTDTRTFTSPSPLNIDTTSTQPSPTPTTQPASPRSMTYLPIVIR